MIGFKTSRYHRCRKILAIYKCFVSYSLIMLFNCFCPFIWNSQGIVRYCNKNNFLTFGIYQPNFTNPCSIIIFKNEHVQVVVVFLFKLRMCTPRDSLILKGERMPREGFFQNFMKGKFSIRAVQYNEPTVVFLVSASQFQWGIEPPYLL